MAKTPKPGDAFSFTDQLKAKIPLIIEHVVLDNVDVRFLTDCRTKTRIPLFVLSMPRCVQIHHLDTESDLMFLTGPGTSMSHEEVSEYLAKRADELSNIAADAACALYDFQVDRREIELKFLSAHA